MPSNAERIAQLREELRRLEAEAADVDAPGERSVTIHGNAEGTVIVTGDGARVLARDAEPDLLWRAYLAFLADDCSQLPLGAIDTEFVRGGGRGVRLSDVYVDLDVTRPGRPQDEDDDERGWSWRLVRGEAQGRTAARDVLAGEGRHFVLLGDPGSGKTTFAHRLCRALAEGEDLPEGLAGGYGNAVDLVTKVLPAREDEFEASLHVAVLCGQAAHELRLQDQVGDRPHYGDVLERVRKGLVEIVDGGLMSPKERLEAGDVLGYLGDPRAGVGVVRVGEAELPSIDWVEIPEGSFSMGSAEEDREAVFWERPQHEVSVGRFWISRYPITNAQYRPFCDSGDYENRDYWTDAGWEWLQGSEVDVSDYPDEWREPYRNWLARRPKEKRRRPFYWDDEKLAAPSRPVVGVTWFEAVAFCRWLTARFQGQSGPVVPGDVGGVSVSLPNEAQWERAARGESGSVWPWGNEFSPGDCNSKEVELNQPSTMGMFPMNRSPLGIVDMAGNVWEWSSTLWGKSWDEPDFGYPYVSDDGREEESSTALRILRGGSFYNEIPYVRCAYRDRVDPGDFLGSIGFRVVLSLAVSGS